MLYFHILRGGYFYFSGVTRFLSKLRFGCDVLEVRFHPLRKAGGAVSVRDVRFQFVFREVHSLARFHLSRLLYQRLSQRTVTDTPPGGAQSLVLLQLGCSPPCSTLPSGYVADFCRSSDLSASGGTFDFRRFRIFPSTSLPPSLKFVTNTLLGLSRPVGKGPKGRPKTSSTTPCGAAISQCG